MAFTQDDLDKLNRAIADGRGARSISFEGQNVMFNSIDDMLKLRLIMMRDIDETIRRFRVVATDKGV